MGLIIDEFSGVATSLFVAKKNAMVEAVCELFGDWRAKGRPVDTVRWDNAGGLFRPEHSPPVGILDSRSNTPVHIRLSRMPLLKKI